MEKDIIKVTMRKILIVDDDETSLMLVQGLLGKSGYEILTTNAGRSALDILENTPGIDLLLLDVVLPDIDGFTLCRQIKTEPWTAHIPIILLSGFRKDNQSIREGLEAGADGYLLKPIEDTALRAWVKATLRISALQRELTQSVPSEAQTYKEVIEGVAKLSHAVNNPLQALYATVDILTLSLPETEEYERMTSEILMQAERVAHLVAKASLQAKAVLNAAETFND